jgi:uncharacterized protein (TIGR02246 family)
VKNSFKSADEVERAFYDAIEHKDIQQMTELWLDDDAIACIHPMGARLAGREQVIGSWQQIFQSESSLVFQLQDISRTQQEELTVHVLHEVITTTDRPDKPTTVIATNIYRQDGQGQWRMLLHHASISPRTVADRQDESGHPVKLH